MMSDWTYPRLVPSAAKTSEFAPLSAGFRVSIEGADAANVEHPDRRARGCDADEREDHAEDEQNLLADRAPRLPMASACSLTHELSEKGTGVRISPV